MSLGLIGSGGWAERFPKVIRLTHSTLFFVHWRMSTLRSASANAALMLMRVSVTFTSTRSAHLRV